MSNNLVLRLHQRMCPDTPDEHTAVDTHDKHTQGVLYLLSAIPAAQCHHACTPETARRRAHGCPRCGVVKTAIWA